MQEKKYLISDFYVGQLDLSYEFDDWYKLKPKTKIDRQKLNNITKLIKNDMIELNGDYIDWETTRQYQSFLTIFLKVSDNYICLDNGQVYNKEYGSEYCKNLKSLKELLPKIDLKLNFLITIEQAMKIFNQLFKDNYLNFDLYGNKSHHISEYFVGTLDLNVGKKNKITENYHYNNLHTYYMFCKYTNKIYSYMLDENEYSVFECPFLFTSRGMINLYDNQIYELTQNNNGNYFFESTQPLSYFLEQIYGLFKEKKLTIPKVLTILKNKK